MRVFITMLLLCTIHIVHGQITAVEYFIDSDPGVGNGTALSVTSGHTINENFSIPTSSLSNGLHVLHIRTKGTNDVWSLYRRDHFYIREVNNPPAPAPITMAEYFIDSDPGVGNATALSLSTDFTINETLAIPTSSLTQGLHVLHIRVKDATDTWSLYYRDYFYIHEVSNIMTSPIEAAEYFFDTDPGVGSATPITIAEGFSINETLSIPVPISLTNGDHYLHIRVKDSDDNWSLYKVALFEVDNELSVSGFKDGKIVIYPNPVKDVLNINTKFNLKCTVLNVQGQIMIPIQDYQKSIDMTNLPSGHYILQLNSKEGTVYKKIIKQ